jgi:hypothetical protein
MTSSISVMPAEGGAPVYITRSLREDGWPTWSPSGLDIHFFSEDQSGHWANWIISRDSVGGPWHEPVETGFMCFWGAWAPDGSGLLCWTRSGGLYRGLALYSRDGHVAWQRDLPAPGRLVPQSFLVYSRDGRTVYESAAHQDGRRGIWAIPLRGGTPRLVIAFDDAALATPGAISVSRDRLYLTVSQYESDIWVANLHW